MTKATNEWRCRECGDMAPVRGGKFNVHGGIVRCTGSGERAPVLVRTALYFTDNGRIACGAHCGMTAQFSGRDISGQKVSRVTAADAAAWLATVGEPIACEDCAVSK